MTDVTHYSLTEDERLMTVRALAVQSLRSPGFKNISLGAAEALGSRDIYFEFLRLLQDVEEPRP